MLSQLRIDEGRADHYQRFLEGCGKAFSLTRISEDFRFQIRTAESPSLLVRQVSTRGLVSHQIDCSDAFYGLMLSHRPGGFSTSAPLSADAAQPAAPTLHWHFPNQLATNHHHDSEVTYLRIESAGLLRQLALYGLRVDQLRNLQGLVSPAGLVQLFHSIDQRLVSITEASKRTAAVEEFLATLGQELRKLLTLPRVSSSSSARHVTAAIEHMAADLAAPLSLPQLSAQLGLTPRAVQVCFRSRLGISPMRWLKLARLSKLRQMLHCPDLSQLSYQALMARVGLSANTLNRQNYREIYGLTPAEDKLQAQLQQLRRADDHDQNSQYLQFSSTASAIAALRELEQQQRDPVPPSAFSISITVSMAEAAARRATPLAS
ncbi:MAG: helix-turn-helix domain-containing protein [Cyanobium sp.]